ncbi:MAG: transposase, partial [Gammaproteobacteria bacterium]|nr:transposase [Gammaproteobacteria bacterium]
QDKGKALAGKSTLNRLELTPLDANEKSRYKKIVANPAAMDNLLIDFFMESHKTPPTEIVLDVDATDDPLHGNQEGRFFHGYYKNYCYLPLYIFCGEQLLCARLRRADQDGATGTVEEVARIVAQIRLVWPEVQIIVRGDSGFCRDNVMEWCETHRVDYVLVQTLRQLGLEGTVLAKAQCDTIRLKLFKVGARIRISVRKVWISFSESYPYADLFQQIFNKLQQIPLRC